MLTTTNIRGLGMSPAFLVCCVVVLEAACAGTVGSGGSGGSSPTGHAGSAPDASGGQTGAGSAGVSGGNTATGGAVAEGGAGVQKNMGGFPADAGTLSTGGGGGATKGGMSGGMSASGGTAGNASPLGGNVGSLNPPGATPGTFPFKPSYIIGADISYTLEQESRGAKYADAGGVKPIEEIMANNGFNYIRLRTFVCPTCSGGYSRQGFCDDKHMIVMAKRVKACGMGILLDFHMADTWVSLGTGAQAASQPSAWKGMTPSQMQSAAYNYTNMVVKEMVDAGVTPDMVQIGNETNAGMSGIPLSNWTDLSALIQAGIKGVKDVNPNIIIWVQNGRPRPDSAGGSNFNGWVDKYLGSEGTKLSVDGVCGSTYGTTNDGADWITSFSYVIDHYKKPVMSCEYTVAPPNDAAGKIINTKVMRGFANHMGWGSFIWEPTQYPGVNKNTLFNVSGNMYTANAAMSEFAALAKSYGLPVPSGKCVSGP